MSRLCAVVYRCPAHHGYRMTMEMDDSGSGVRVLGMKCCANQYGEEVCRWTPTLAEAEAIIDELSGVEAP